MIGLLAATGMRVGEVIGLNRDDIAWDDAVLTISTAKFGKSRNIPLLGSTMAALADYAETRDRLCLQPSTPAFFVSMRGTRLLYQRSGWPSDASVTSRGSERIVDPAENS